MNTIITVSTINKPLKMAKMRALVTEGQDKVSVQEIDVPTPSEGEILVKVNYVAQNPTDW